MDTLSKVSEYLNNLEDFLDDGDSLEARNIKVEKSKKELEMFEALGHKSQGVWNAELDMADSHNYMMEERFYMLGFVRVDYGDYRRKIVKEVHVEIHGFTFLVDFVVIGYANEGEPSIIFGRDFLVTTKSKVDFGVGEIRIDLNMLEEERNINALVELIENMEEVGCSNRELVTMGKSSQNKGHNVNKLTPPPPPKIEEIQSLQSIARQPVYHPLS
nr:hypothetical protein [Tanacetum cinerariifolium]